MIFVGITTITAGIMNVTGIYIPQIGTPKHHVQGMINLALTLVIMACVVIIIRDALPAWIREIRKSRHQGGKGMETVAIDPNSAVKDSNEESKKV